jgi:hypothetical protein
MLLLTSCATTSKAPAPVEEFRAGTTYSRVFAATKEQACEGVRRALLSQGYLVHEATASLVTADKNFQPDSERHEQIEFNVVCAANSTGSETSSAFANAVRDTYSLKKSSNSASVGVGVLGSLSLPFGSSDDSMVKVASETITTKKFYEQFFEQVESYLDKQPPQEVPAGAADK